MPKLTKRIVDAALPGPDERFIWDDQVKGFGLRVKPSGAKSYVLKYRVGTRTRRYTIGKHGSPWTSEQARLKAIELLRGLATGIDPMEAKAEARAALTVKELAELYVTEGRIDRPNKKLRSWEADQSIVNRHILPLLGQRLAKSLTQTDVAQFQADVAAGKTAADIRTRPRGRAIVTGGRSAAARSTGTLAAILEWAAGRGLLSGNPAKGVKLLKRESKERFLSDREVAALADALATLEDERAINPAMAAAIRLLMLTGARKGEILGLRWEWIDFDRGCIRLPDSKTGAKVVPLAAAALDILSALPRPSPYVLPAAKGGGHVVGLQKAWDRLRERAGLPGLRLHDLRHSFASFAVADGASLYLVGKVLGHRQARTTELYAHLSDDPLRAVAERTAARIAAAMTGGSANKGDQAEIVPLPTAESRKR